MALATCFPVLSVSNYARAFALNTHDRHEYPSPTRILNLRTCGTRGLKSSSSFSSTPPRRGFRVVCEAVNEVNEGVEKERMAFAGRPVLLQPYSYRASPADDGSITRYLSYNKSGVVECSDHVEVTSPKARFVLEKSNNREGFVHIKCCYNNKYVMRREEFEPFMVAQADKIEEDQTKWSCTLLEPVNAHDDGTIMFRQPQGCGQYSFLSIAYSKSDSTPCLYLSRGGGMSFKVIEWDKLVIFPKHVAFKGDNGCYLSARTIKGQPYLQFASKDIADPSVGHEVFVNKDGTLRIKSNHFGKFWRRGHNWIWCDFSDGNPYNPDSLFLPVKIDRNVVALRNVGNNNYCKRLTSEGKTDCLNANIPDITTEGHIEVEELVLSRTIYDVEFHVDDARVEISKGVILGASETADNATQETHSTALKTVYTNSSSSTWSRSVSLSLGVKATFETGIPLVLDGKVEITAQVAGTNQWGEAHTTSTSVDVWTTVTMPPMSKRRVVIVATKGSCEIPFSYYQRDLLTNGKYVTEKKNDGLYTGANHYDISTRIVALPYDE